MQGEELLYKMSFVFLVGLGRKIVILYLMGLTFFVAVFLLFSYFTYEKALEERQKVEQGLEEILSLSQGSKEPKRPEEKEKGYRPADEKRGRKIGLYTALQQR